MLIQIAERVWAPGVVHDTVAAVVRDPAFRRNLRESIGQRFMMWLGELIAYVIRFVQGSSLARPLGLALVALIVVLVVARLLFAARAREEGASITSRRGRKGAAEDPFIVADGLASEGRFEEAAHALYRGVLLSLSRSERMRLDPSKTSGDYARELRRRGSASYQAFRTFARRFDVAVYGHGRCDAAAHRRSPHARGSIRVTRAGCMSEPTPTPPDSREWWTKPRVVLPLVGALVVLVALLTPQANSGRTGDERLTTHLSGPLNARVLYETAGRLGWRVSQRDSVASPRATDGATIHAVLAPTRPMTPEVAHQYLNAVRGGDAMLLVLDERTPLSDSLGVRHSTGGGTLNLIAADTAGCRRSLDLPLWPDGRVHLWTLRWLRGEPAGRVVFGTTHSNVGEPPRVTREAAAGFTLGAGRVVVVADPDLLRNDVVRRCSWGADVRVVRMLEWLRAGGATPRTALAFDEYHHGYGRSQSLVRTAGRFLVEHPVGRTLLQAALAALVLLLAVAPRALPPADVLRVERRDPLEQIDALAQAYEQVHATRTVAARLLHGLRWRVERGWSLARSRPDDAFLDDAASRVPALSDDVALVRRALHETVPDRDLPELGARVAADRADSPRLPDPHDPHRRAGRRPSGPSPFIRRNVRRGPGGDGARCARRLSGARARAHRGRARHGEDAARARARRGARPAIRAHPVHAGPHAVRRDGGERAARSSKGIRVPARTGVHRSPARRRDQPRAREDAVARCSRRWPSGRSRSTACRGRWETSFTVFATQNPVEHEGTYPLPEAQLDRFLVKTVMPYPSREAELELLARYESGFDAERLVAADMKAALAPDDATAVRQLVDSRTRRAGGARLHRRHHALHARGAHAVAWRLSARHRRAVPSIARGRRAGRARLRHPGRREGESRPPCCVTASTSRRSSRWKAGARTTCWTHSSRACACRSERMTGPASPMRGARRARGLWRAVAFVPTRRLALAFALVAPLWLLAAWSARRVDRDRRAGA